MRELRRSKTGFHVELLEAGLDRQALFSENVSWVRGIARSVKKTLPASFDFEDLVQEGLIEMWRRAQIYDPTVNDSFQAYAYMAVRGAMLMKCRRRHWLDATADRVHASAADHRPFGVAAIEMQRARAVEDIEVEAQRTAVLTAAESLAEDQRHVIVRTLENDDIEADKETRRLLSAGTRWLKKN